MSDMRPQEPLLINPPEFSPVPEPVFYPPPKPPRQRGWVHVLLFLLTVVSTVLVGGWMFSAGLLSILLAHEFGHYFAARWYRVPASLPYFIPFPFSLFGTLGAFIRMSPWMPNRRALFDIAAAGPLAGLVLAIPLSYIGIANSRIVHTASMPGHFISLGEPFLFQFLGWMAHGSIGKDMDLLLHPLAFAGWAGMFVTALNLLPIGQLDGGHISYALFGPRSRLVAQTMFGGLAIFSLARQNFVWVPLLVFLLFLGVRHPHSMDDDFPLGRKRQAIGALLGAIFILCFSLVPIKF
ncbi:MAG: site-2 protease family protein [Acidobacteria bacterium]|nr:site-2 protease family protein [Acidobacteriota bacterium]